MFRKKPTYDQYLSFCLKYKIKRNQQTYTIQLNFTHIKYCKYTFYSECVRIFRGLTHKQKNKKRLRSGHLARAGARLNIFRWKIARK